MSGPNFLLDKGRTPTAAVDQFRAVKATTTKEACTQATAGEEVLGIAQEGCTTAEAANGKVINVRLFGISTAIAGGAIAQDAYVKVTTGGKLIATSTAGDRVVGRAMTAAAADNDWFEVWLLPGVKV